MTDKKEIVMTYFNRYVSRTAQKNEMTEEAVKNLILGDLLDKKAIEYRRE